MRPTTDLWIKHDRIIKQTATSHEIAWYENLPKRLQKYGPHIYISDPLTMEKVDACPLYLSHNEIPWNLIKDLIKDMTAEQELTANIDDYIIEYIDKPRERTKFLRDSNETFNELTTGVSFKANGETIENLINTIIPRQYCFCYGHGDLTFSNILWNQADNYIKLVDPRGKFGTTSGCDILYDLAKLRYSAAGLYDSIRNNLFTFEMGDNSVSYVINGRDRTREFDYEFSDYPIDDIKKIQGTIHLSAVGIFTDTKQAILHYCEGMKLLRS